MGKKPLATLMAQSVEDLQRRMPNVRRRDLCWPDTDIVIEGYPRSGNTYTLDMLNILQAPDAPKLKVAHHTHRIENMIIGQKLGKPLLLLIRKPEDAILSFMLFSGHDAAVAAQRYLNFHRAVLQLGTPLIVFDFQTIILDFNAVVDAVNTATGAAIPRSVNLAEDTRKARAKTEQRARALHGDKYAARIGAPNAERDVLKAQRRAEAAEFLGSFPEVNAIYDQVLAHGAT